MSRRKNFGKSRSRHLAVCSSLAVGAGGGFLSACLSEAAVVPYNPPGGPVTISVYGGFHGFDIDGDGTRDFTLYGDYFGHFEFRGDYLDLNRILNTGSFAAVVPSGGTIGPDSSGWLEDTTLDLFTGIRGYAGVVFDIPGGSPHFAYLDFSVEESDTSYRTLTLYGGAYESLANTPIQVPVPEPSSLVLLASGAASLALWRRRTSGRPESML
jgi:hypothetical protein